MNDCLWSWICVCECNGKCEKYLSVNSEKGREISEQYNRDVEGVLEPVREKYKKKYM